MPPYEQLESKKERKHMFWGVAILVIVMTIPLIIRWTIKLIQWVS